ncbi:MAG: hypothetical protein JF616_12005 [Fibrobacteres bacterium]|nr:hypothetical protein [Fibrobacterota bacterium]
MNESLFSPEPWDITRDRVRWLPVDRSEALGACLYRRVAVVHRLHSIEAAEWLRPDSRFFRSDGAFPYDGLRYFVHTGVERRPLQALKVHRPVGEKNEVLETEDEAGDAVNLGSPEKKKKLPIQFRLLDIDGGSLAGIAYEVALPDGTTTQGKSDSDGWIRLMDNTKSGEAKLKIIPEQAHENKSGATA